MQCGHDDKALKESNIAGKLAQYTSQCNFNKSEIFSDNCCTFKGEIKMYFQVSWMDSAWKIHKLVFTCNLIFMSTRFDTIENCVAFKSA